MIYLKWLLLSPDRLGVAHHATVRPSGDCAVHPRNAHLVGISMGNA